MVKLFKHTIDEKFNVKKVVVVLVVFTVVFADVVARLARNAMDLQYTADAYSD